MPTSSGEKLCSAKLPEYEVELHRTCRANHRWAADAIMRKAWVITLE
jgi:hypothetical protein